MHCTSFVSQRVTEIVLEGFRELQSAALMVFLSGSKCPVSALLHITPASLLVALLLILTEMDTVSNPLIASVIHSFTHIWKKALN